MNDRTLMKIKYGIFEVKATDCDMHLGDEDLDNRIVDLCLQDFKR